MACNCYCHRIRGRVVSSRALYCLAYKTYDDEKEPSCDICIEGDPLNAVRSNVSIRTVNGTLDGVF